MSISTARRLTKREVAAILGVSQDVVANWTTTRVIPPELVYKGDGREHSYSPVVVALGLLIADLIQKLGPKSPIPFEVARQVAPQLAQSWNETLPIRLRVLLDENTEMVFGRLDALRRAQAMVASAA